MCSTQGGKPGWAGPRTLPRTLATRPAQPLLPPPFPWARPALLPAGARSRDWECPLHAAQAGRLSGRGRPNRAARRRTSRPGWLEAPWGSCSGPWPTWQTWSRHAPCSRAMPSHRTRPPRAPRRAPGDETTARRRREAKAGAAAPFGRAWQPLSTARQNAALPRDTSACLRTNAH